MMLDDLEFQWKRGRLPNLLPAVELIMLVVLNADNSVKVWNLNELTVVDLLESAFCSRISSLECVKHDVLSGNKRGSLYLTWACFVLVFPLPACVGVCVGGCNEEMAGEKAEKPEDR